MGPPSSNATENMSGNSCQKPASTADLPPADMVDFQRLSFDFDPDQPKKCAHDLLHHFRPDLQQRLVEEALIVKVRMRGTLQDLRKVLRYSGGSQPLT